MVVILEPKQMRPISASFESGIRGLRIEQSDRALFEVKVDVPYFRLEGESRLREVAGAEAPPLKKFSSKVQGKNFPFSYLTISNFSIISAG